MQKGQELCVIGDCSSLRYSKTTGLCRTHHKRWQTGFEYPERLRKVYYDCSVEECEGLAFVKGLCVVHESQRKYGSIPSGPGAPRHCVVRGCDRPVKNVQDSLCQTHAKKGAGHAPRGDRLDWAPCAIRTCARHAAAGVPLCSYHRQRSSAYGLSHEEYLELIGPGVCMGCGSLDRVLAVHHDHSCCNVGDKSCGDCVLAALCAPCNKSAGMAGDDPEVLLRLAEICAMEPWRERKKG